MKRQELLERAFGLAEAAAGLVARVRRFFYAVMLQGQACPACGGALQMEREGLCRCGACGSAFDPTVCFQRCSSCGGRARLRVRRYQCETCGRDVASRFLFDGLVFNAAYFRQKMEAHRQRKRDLRQRVQEMLCGTRSNSIEIPPVGPSDGTDLWAALDALAGASGSSLRLPAEERFDLRRYERHVRENLRPTPLSLDDIPPLQPVARIDRIRRFIAIIFLAHAGLLKVWQVGSNIMVIPRETHAEGQELPGDAEDADGVSRPMGRAEA